MSEDILHSQQDVTRQEIHMEPGQAVDDITIIVQP